MISYLHSVFTKAFNHPVPADGNTLSRIGISDADVLNALLNLKLWDLNQMGYYQLFYKSVLPIFEFEFATFKQTDILKANIFVKHDCACTYTLRWRINNVTKMIW